MHACMDLKRPEFTREFFQTDNTTKDSEDTIHTTVFTVSKTSHNSSKL